MAPRSGTRGASRTPWLKLRQSIFAFSHARPVSNLSAKCTSRVTQSFEEAVAVSRCVTGWHVWSTSWAASTKQRPTRRIGQRRRSPRKSAFPWLIASCNSNGYLAIRRRPLWRTSAAAIVQLALAVAVAAAPEPAPSRQSVTRRTNLRQWWIGSPSWSRPWAPPLRSRPGSWRHCAGSSTSCTCRSSRSTPRRWRLWGQSGPRSTARRRRATPTRPCSRGAWTRTRGSAASAASGWTS
mmetsp:Transcript_75209/g.244566  ORF Transcript_75209/g.244566 Transcript_75209/m.244566 type:complete len:238 (-) Transcript_75209:1290-2003(-)